MAVNDRLARDLLDTLDECHRQMYGRDPEDSDNRAVASVAMSGAILRTLARNLAEKDDRRLVIVINNLHRITRELSDITKLLLEFEGK